MGRYEASVETGPFSDGPLVRALMKEPHLDPVVGAVEVEGVDYYWLLPKPQRYLRHEDQGTWIETDAPLQYED